MQILSDVWSLFDMLIVLVCLVLTILKIIDPSLGDNQYFRVSGTLRLLRLIVLLRRLNLMRKIRQTR